MKTVFKKYVCKKLNEVSSECRVRVLNAAYIKKSKVTTVGFTKIFVSKIILRYFINECKLINNYFLNVKLNKIRFKEFPSE